VTFVRDGDLSQEDAVAVLAARLDPEDDLLATAVDGGAEEADRAPTTASAGKMIRARTRRRFIDLYIVDARRQSNH
jgi:hypothetical protein